MWVLGVCEALSVSLSPYLSCLIMLSRCSDGMAVNSSLFPFPRPSIGLSWLGSEGVIGVIGL